MADMFDKKEGRDRSDRRERRGLLSTLIRFIVNAIVLYVVSFIVPGFRLISFWPAVLAAVIISVIDFIVDAIFGVSASPFGRGLSGFVVSVLIIYFTQVFIPGMTVTFLGAIFAAIIIGLINFIIPEGLFE